MSALPETLGTWHPGIGYHMYEAFPQEFHDHMLSLDQVRTAWRDQSQCSAATQMCRQLCEDMKYHYEPHISLSQQTITGSSYHIWLGPFSIRPMGTSFVTFSSVTNGSETPELTKAVIGAGGRLHRLCLTWTSGNRL